MAIVSRVSEALAALLAGASFGVPIEVMRAYQVTTDLRNLAGVRVTITPDTLAVSLPVQSMHKYFDWRIAVYVQAITPGEVEDVDLLVELIEDIIALAWTRPFGAEAGFARVIAAETMPPIDPERLATKDLFHGGLFLTYRVQKK